MTSTSQTLPELPGDAVFHYIAEGAANIVYSFTSATHRFNSGTSTPEPSVVEEYGDGTPPPSSLDFVSLDGSLCESDKLVRFRKDLPTTAPCATAQANWEHAIKPLLPVHQLVNQALVKLQPGVVAELNQNLQDWEIIGPSKEGSLDFTHSRPHKRRGTYLADDKHALLVTDMRAKAGEEVIEFKPKWLAQSPSAPENSKRCRQCARMARTNAEQARRGEESIPFFCPFYFSARDHRILYQCYAGLIMPPGTQKDKVERFTQWLLTTDLLQNLHRRQVELDKVGVLEGDVNDEGFLAAMTLRDCTVYVKCTSADPREWEARIGDLDLKSKEKINYWRGIERLLIDEGWYKGAEKEADKQPNVCRLSRSFS